MASLKNWFQTFEPKRRKRFFAYAGLICGGIFGFYYYFIGSKDFIVATSANSIWMFVYFTIAVIVLRKNREEDFWRNYLIGAAIYVAGAAVGILLGIISTIVLAIVVALAFVSGVFFPNFNFGGGGGGASSNGNTPGFQHNCCYTCSRYSNGQCLKNPGQPISDPGSTVCNEFMRQ